MAETHDRCREPFAFMTLYLICEKDKHDENECHSAQALIGKMTVNIQWTETKLKYPTS